MENFDIMTVQCSSYCGNKWDIPTFLQSASLMNTIVLCALHLSSMLRTKCNQSEKKHCPMFLQISGKSSIMKICFLLCSKQNELNKTQIWSTSQFYSNN